MTRTSGPHSPHSVRPLDPIRWRTSRYERIIRAGDAHPLAFVVVWLALFSTTWVGFVLVVLWTT